MAEKLKSLSKLTKQSKKTWIIIGVIAVIFIVFWYFRSGSSVVSGPNNSSAPNAPNVQNLPGGQVSPEYYKALIQSNTQSAQQAQSLGQTSVATLVDTNTPGFNQPTPTACTQTCCSCQTPTLQNTVNGWLASGKISKNTAQALAALDKQGLSVSGYEDALEQMVKSGQLTPEQARELLEQYKKLHGANLAAASAKQMDALIQAGALPLDGANALLDLQKNGASVDSYAEELAALVKAGKISPAEAAELLAEYKKRHGGLQTVSLNQLINAGLPGSFAAGASGNQLLANPGVVQVNGRPQFQDGQVASPAMTEQEQALQQAQQAQTQALATSMATQAGSIIKDTEPTVQSALIATPVATEPGIGQRAAGQGSGYGDNNGAPPTVKAGDIEFAVLDTAVDSDYPTSPVMATIVQGKLKGGKLIGQLSMGGNSNNDRVILNFTLLNMPDWPTPVQISAVAIDPDTARSALATSVDYHYLTRYGAIFASAFLAGYGQTFTQAGQTVVTGGSQPYVINSNTLSPSQRIFAGLGQVGTQTSTAAQQYFNKPPTVKVKSGVGLGILFLQNVSSTATANPSGQPGQSSQPLLMSSQSGGQMPPPSSPVTSTQSVTSTNNK